jgi:hypothetical protein
MKTIYTLVIKRNDRWIPEFGSYDREKVVRFRDEYEGYASVILQTGDGQSDIDDAVTILNLKWG